MAVEFDVSKVENEGDLRDLASLQDLYDPEFFRNTNPNPKINGGSALETIVNFYQNGYDFWIARSGQEIVGYAQGSSSDSANYDCLVYVKPGFRNKGIDRKLMLKQIDFAREKKYLEMRLAVLSDEASYSSLDNMGFIIMGSGPSSIHSFFLLNSLNLLKHSPT